MNITSVKRFGRLSHEEKQFDVIGPHGFHFHPRPAVIGGAKRARGFQTKVAMVDANQMNPGILDSFAEQDFPSQVGRK
jgi:hypothetical protein